MGSCKELKEASSSFVILMIARVWRARGLELREIAGILQLFFRVQRTKSTEQWVKTFGSQPGESSCSFQLFDTVIYWIFIRIC